MRGVVRRARLPLVVSLFLAALLGAPATPAVSSDPLPAPVTAVAAPTASAPATVVTETVVVEPAAVPTAAVAPVLIIALPLADQVSTAATAPRGPPRTV